MPLRRAKQVPPEVAPGKLSAMGGGLAKYRHLDAIPGERYSCNKHSTNNILIQAHFYIRGCVLKIQAHLAEFTQKSKAKT